MKRFKFYEIAGITLIVALTVFSGFSCVKASDNAQLEGVSWVLKFYGQPGNLTNVLPSAEVTLIAEKANSHVSGSGGVNGYGGDFSVNGDKLTITNLIHTMIASTNQALNEQENTFFSILGSAQSFKINDDELTITGTSGILVMTQK
ncbi:MAG: META domain-containing protein [Dehalococcoidales bacterium]|jgi:heat shock protein HslJ